MDKKKMEKKKHHLYEFSSGPHRERALLPCRKMYYMTVATERQHTIAKILKGLGAPYMRGEIKEAEGSIYVC